MRAIRYGDKIGFFFQQGADSRNPLCVQLDMEREVDFSELCNHCSRNPLCVQLDMEIYGDDRWSIDISVAIRYACN